MSNKWIEKFKNAEIAVSCDTKEKSDIFIDIMNTVGVELVTGIKIPKEIWEGFRGKTFYGFSEFGGGLVCGNVIKDNQQYHGAPIIPFDKLKEFDLEEKEQIKETEETKEVKEKKEVKETKTKESKKETSKYKKRKEQVKNYIDTNVKETLEDGTEVYITINEKGVPQSHVPGVTWDKYTHNWEVRISVNGKRKRIGHFDDVVEAAKARKEAERKKKNGEFKE